LPLFLSKNISLTSPVLDNCSPAKYERNINILNNNNPVLNYYYSAGYSNSSSNMGIGAATTKAKVLQNNTLTKEQIMLHQLQPTLHLDKQTANSFSSMQSIEFNKNFNNLVNAKSTIIGKIRSIKLVELMDKLREEILIAENLAALKRAADITDLNLINKKKFRRMNTSKYLNKKNIKLSNRIKILQTIETIKTDFRFEPKLDSNLLSSIPVSLLYYSNLIPVQQPVLKNAAAGSGKITVQRQRLHANNNSIISLKSKGAGNVTITSSQISTSTQEQGINCFNVKSVEAENPPILSSYLKELSIYNRETKGIINYYSKIVGYNFNTNYNKISSSIYDLLEASFKVMHCLISKPVYVITPEKITIQLFYFLLVAKKKKIKNIRKRLRYNISNSS
jgi:hypothetical protein